MNGKEKGDRHSTIKIKLNGKEQTFSEETAIHDWQSATNEASAASSEEIVEDEFEWILPNDEKNEVPEYKIINATNDNIRKLPVRTWNRNIKSSFSGLFLSVFLAIAVGLILGFIIYKMVIQTEESHVGLKEGDSPPVVEKESQAAKNEKYSMTLPEITISVLQGGFYSSNENAVSAGEQLAANNVATTVIEMEGKYYVFIGVAGELSTAKSLASQLKEQGLEDVWAKELSFGGKSIELSSKEEADQLTKEVEAIHKLAEQSAVGYLNGSLDGNVLKDVENTLNGNFHEEIAKELHGSLKSAETHLKGFQTSQSKSELLQAQQVLLEFIKLYKGEIGS
ncbi:hypothetical protein KHA93_09110 [Bacillus sp. FJAT-49732]|uniref:SPOR domain-containing protein n=1 Tax=Lederbergia citrisecunda TaxID=2833583 RepID=A0A942TKJ9_9BACI|nr:hypothetical protein [Lederbergia citrisecunda]MBS4199815.1 hypothetical protein [Lederbergia citrisecunda]